MKNYTEIGCDILVATPLIVLFIPIILIAAIPLFIVSFLVGLTSSVLNGILKG